MTRYCREGRTHRAPRSPFGDVMQLGKIEEIHMTTAIERHPPVAEKSAADLRVPESTTVNGIDTGKLSATIDAIKADASLASFQFRLSNRWVGGGENHSVIDDFYG